MVEGVVDPARGIGQGQEAEGRAGGAEPVGQRGQLAPPGPPAGGGHVGQPTTVVEEVGRLQVVPYPPAVSAEFVDQAIEHAGVEDRWLHRDRRGRHRGRRPVRRAVPLPRRPVPDRGQGDRQRAEMQRLGQHPVRSGPEAGPSDGVGRRRTHDDHRRTEGLGQVGTYPARGLPAVRAGEVDVHQHHVVPGVAQDGQCGDAAGCCRGTVSEVLDHRQGDVPAGGVVVDHQDPERRQASRSSWDRPRVPGAGRAWPRHRTGSGTRRRSPGPPADRTDGAGAAVGRSAGLNPFRCTFPHDFLPRR